MINTRALIKILSVAIAVVVSLMLLNSFLFNDATLQNYGLLGVFLTALLSHLSIVARSLFLPIFLSLTEFYNPLFLGLVAGLGGALGEVAAYYWGSGIRDALDNQKVSNPMPKWAERYGLLLILFFASSPLPDTPIILLAGSLRLPMWKILLVQFAGKSILYLAGAYIGGFIFLEIKSAIEDQIILSTMLLVISILLCVFISWRKSRETILKVLGRLLRSAQIYGG